VKKFGLMNLNYLAKRIKCQLDSLVSRIVMQKYKK